MIVCFLVSTATTSTEHIRIDDEVDLNSPTSSRRTLLRFLFSLGGFVFAPAREVLNRQDHHTFRTHELRKFGVFASTEAAIREDEEQVGDKEERDD